MADTVLESFLIKLGYQIDQGSAKTFSNTIAESIKGVTALAGAIAGMAVAVEQAVSRTTQSIQRLNFSATMGGVTAQKMRELGATAEAMGGSYEELISAQVNLNQTLAAAPWLQSSFNSLVRGHQQNIRGVIDEYHRLASGPGGERAGAVYALQMKELFGISTQVLVQAHRNYDLIEKQDKHNQLMVRTFGVSMEDADKKARIFHTSWLNLGQTIDYMWKSSAGGLSNILTTIFDKFDKWLIDSAPDIQRFFRELNPVIQKATDATLAWMDGLLKAYREGGWKEAWQYIKTSIETGWEVIKPAFEPMIAWMTDVGIRVGKQILWGMWTAIKAGMGEDSDLGAAFKVGGVVLGGIMAKSLLSAMVTTVVAGAGAAASSIVAAIAATGLVGLFLGHHGRGAPGTLSDPKRLTEPEKDTSPYKGISPLDPTMPAMPGPGQKYQHGGIVPISAHAGEMVLPRNISEGLQNLYGGGGYGNYARDFSLWLSGNKAFRPVMDLAQDFYDKMTQAFTDALDKYFPTKDQISAGGGVGGGTSGEYPGYGYGRGRGGYGGHGGTAGDVSVGDVPEAKKASIQQLAKFAKEKLGLDDAHIAAMLGSAWVESGVNPAGKRGAAGEEGMFQWLGSRWTALQRSLGDRQRNPYAQFEYALREMDKIDPGWRTRPGNARDLSWQWVSRFERPKNPSDRWQAVQKMQEVMRQAGGATLPSTVAPGTNAVQGAVGAINAVIGDSIGEGVSKALGLPTGMSFSGKTPEYIAAQLLPRMKELAGKNVAFAMGSNPKGGNISAGNMSAMRGLLKALHDVGAHVTMLGVGTGASNFMERNRQLEALSKEYGVSFAGALRDTEGGRLHPHSYKPAVEQLKGADNSHNTYVFNNMSESGTERMVDRVKYGYDGRNAIRLTGRTMMA